MKLGGFLSITPLVFSGVCICKRKKIIVYVFNEKNEDKKIIPFMLDSKNFKFNIKPVDYKFST